MAIKSKLKDLTDRFKKIQQPDLTKAQNVIKQQEAMKETVRTLQKEKA